MEAWLPIIFLAQAATLISLFFLGKLIMAQLDDLNAALQADEGDIQTLSDNVTAVGTELTTLDADVKTLIQKIQNQDLTGAIQTAQDLGTKLQTAASAVQAAGAAIGNIDTEVTGAGGSPSPQAPPPAAPGTTSS